MRTGARTAGVIAVLALALLVPSAASGYSPATSSSFFGVNGAMLRGLTNPDEASSLDGLAASMGQQGISWARLTFDQSVEERQAGAFNWYVPDTMIAARARHGVRGAASFVGPAAWGDAPETVSFGGSRARPSNIAVWADWVAAAARRYGSNGSFW